MFGSCGGIVSSSEGWKDWRDGREEGQGTPQLELHPPMRAEAASPDGLLTAKAVSGTLQVCIGLDVSGEARKGLLGFSIQRSRLPDKDGKPGAPPIQVRSDRYFPPIQLHNSAAESRRRRSARLRPSLEAGDDLEQIAVQLPAQLHQSFCIIDSCNSTAAEVSESFSACELQPGGRYRYEVVSWYAKDLNKGVYGGAEPLRALEFVIQMEPLREERSVVSRMELENEKGYG